MADQTPTPAPTFRQRTRQNLAIFGELGRMLQANLSLSSLLSIGMLLQALVLLVFPSYIAALPAAILLLSRALKANPKTIASNPYLRGAQLGRHSASVPNEDGTIPEKKGENGVVCFVLGTQTNHPLGIFAPNFREVGDYYGAIFREAEASPDKWGFLSRSPNMTSVHPTRGNFLVTLSYWRDLDSLKRFAFQGSHNKAMQWWYKVSKDTPHVGIFHETYVVPPGHYETIYHNVWPFGMGAIGAKAGDGAMGAGTGGSEGGLGTEKAEGKAWRSMHVRMGREV